MATVNGTILNDFIHRAGDGKVPPGGSNEIAQTTTDADDINAGLGNDTVFGDAGDDSAFFNVLLDGADAIDLGAGDDEVEVVALVPTQVRLTFTSSEVGNGSPTDSNTMANQDGGLAVRLQAENGSDGLTGPVTRADDEGITFVGGPGVTFDVRDLVSGAARGDQFNVVTLGTLAGDVIPGGIVADRSYYINGGQGDDVIGDGALNDFLVGGAGADTLTATLGNDSFIGGGGDDEIAGGAGTDVATLNVATDGADAIDLGSESDVVNVNTAAGATTNVRLTFTSSEVGNGVATDSNTMANQDGGLAVRLQAEDGSDGLTGPVTRTDDEGITFVAGTGVTFDVRDLVIGAARGDKFEVVTLGTLGDDTLGAVQNARPYYINGGQGADTITDGTSNDFLVGGAGNDTLTASLGNDSFIGGGGNDSITGGAGSDVATLNVATDGADAIDLGSESDVVNVNTAAGATTNVRLTFTSSEVGNGVATDSNTMANQDGGLAVRLQAEDGSDGLTGPITQTDDEGVTFVAGAGVTFDVRDLVSGAARGDKFEVVTLGTNAGELLTAVQNLRPYYINAGQGDDSILGGQARDFLVGGAGNDELNGRFGADSFIGGAGDDSLLGGRGADTAIHNVLADGADAIDLSAGSDLVNVNTAAGATTNVRLTFTSAEVGNGVSTDAGTLANQDGGLAVRMQAEDGSDGLTGPVTRVDDEGVTFVAGVGVTFDVRDLVSGTARGDQFEVVSLGTEGDNVIVAQQAARPYYINAGQGDDTLVGGDDNDFLVGGAGVDRMRGGAGDDSYIVDNVADRVVEENGGGTDLVLSAVSFSLTGQEIENLTLTGTAETDGQGNVRSNVLTGNTAANELTGGRMDDTLLGGDGDDTLMGGRGGDELTGGTGADAFAFGMGFNPGNVDAITDFTVGEDVIQLDDRIFKGLDVGTLGDEAFYTGAAATEADDRIIYDDATGNLFYDRDGSGDGFEAKLFATLDAGLDLSADDFRIV